MKSRFDHEYIINGCHHYEIEEGGDYQYPRGGVVKKWFGVGKGRHKGIDPLTLNASFSLADSRRECFNFEAQSVKSPGRRGLIPEVRADPL